MIETNSHTQWFSDNERNWDDRAELHMAGNYCDYQRLLEDPTAISIELAQDIERFGDLAGKDVIHLQCHVGTDTIGFARRGASRVIGLDLSEASLAHARSIAERAGADVEFVHANVYDARQAVSGTFDLVYTRSVSYAGCPISPGGRKSSLPYSSRAAPSSSAMTTDVHDNRGGYFRRAKD